MCGIILKKEWSGLEPYGDVPDLEDVILMGLGDVVCRVLAIFGNDSVAVSVGGKDLIIRRPEDDPAARFEDRLEMIIESGREMAESNGVAYEDIVGVLFVVDGWSWNENVFRAPAWMDDHREIEIEVARGKEGLGWLSGNSLEVDYENTSMDEE